MITKKGASGPTNPNFPKLGGGSFERVILHDYSLGPRKNDRLAKLGFGVMSRFVSIAAYDDDSKVISYNDTDGHPISTMDRPEPDNWTPVDRGGGDKTWELRTSVDHTNHVQDVAHRSTISLDQRKSQRWWYSQDRDWGVVIKNLAPPEPKSRRFNGAGFQTILYGRSSSSGSHRRPGKSGATFIWPSSLPAGGDFRIENNDVETESNQGPKRATGAWNINQRAGYASDGKYVAQAHHGFYMMPTEPPSPGEHPPTQTESAESFRSKNQAKGLGGYQQFGKHPGQIESRFFSTQDQQLRVGLAAGQAGVPAAEESGGPDASDEVEPRQFAFRPDAWWDIEGRPSAFAFEESAPARGEDHYEGFFWVSPRPSPRHPLYRPAIDKSSDQPIFEFKDAPNGIRVVVPLPRQSHTPPPCWVPTHFNPSTGGGPATGVIPPIKTGSNPDPGVFSGPLPLMDRSMTAYDFPPGVITQKGFDIVIPPVFNDTKFIVEVPYTLPVAIGGSDTMNFHLFYRAMDGPGRENGEDWLEMTQSLSAAHNPTTEYQVRAMRFEIPARHLSKLGGGGRIHCYFMRRSDDSSAERFRLVGNIQSTAVPAKSRTTHRFGGAA